MLTNRALCRCAFVPRDVFAAEIPSEAPLPSPRLVKPAAAPVGAAAAWMWCVGRQDQRECRHREMWGSNIFWGEEGLNAEK